MKGPYLNDVYADWVFHDRERLNQIYLNALSTLGSLYQTSARPEKALEVCQRAIAYDPGFEAAYQISMQVYNRLGDKVSVKRTYQAYVEAMQRQYNMPPSAEMRELYQRLSR